MTDDLEMPLGGKRKYKENPLTAKVESGTLKIKIVRKDAPRLLSRGGPFEDALHGRRPGSRGSMTTTELMPPSSPPKPRPNRKHVPIFYQQPNAFSLSGTGFSTSSTDEPATTGAHAAFSDSVAHGSSTSSTTNRFAGIDLGPPPLSSELSLQSSLSSLPGGNPLFSRGNSDNASTIGDLLRHAFPMAAPFDISKLPGGSVADAMPPPTMPATSTALQTSLFHHSPTSALHQLAVSSTAYEELARSGGNNSGRSTSSPNNTSSVSMATSSMSSSSTSSSQPYRFNPMVALQEARRLASVTSSESDKQEDNGADHNGDQSKDAAGNDDSELGPPPPGPPSFRIQHSLMGGGIGEQSLLGSSIGEHSFMSSSGGEHSLLGSSGGERSLLGTGVSDLGPPPSAPPSFRIEHSLMGGGIDMQPVIANVNSKNFDWNRHHEMLRQRSSLLSRPVSAKIDEDSDSDDAQEQEQKEEEKEAEEQKQDTSGNGKKRGHGLEPNGRVVTI